MNLLKCMRSSIFPALAGALILLSCRPVCSETETAGTGGEPTEAPVKDKWALVVGISEFAKPALNLQFAAKDACDFKDFLVGKCHFAPDHVKLLVNQNATKDKILDLLGDSWLPRVALPDDLVVIFISRHSKFKQDEMLGSGD